MFKFSNLGSNNYLFFELTAPALARVKFRIKIKSYIAVSNQYKSFLVPVNNIFREQRDLHNLG